MSRSRTQMTWRLVVIETRTKSDGSRGREMAADVLKRTMAVGLGVVLLSLVTVGCGGGSESSASPELADSLERIEQRLAALDARLREVEVASDTLDALDARVASSERLAERVEIVEKRANEMYDDTIDQLIGVRESLTKQISKIRIDAAEKKMRQAAARDVGELQHRLEAGGINLDPEAKEMTVAGSICQRDTLVEFLAVGPGGREHESVLFMDCAPSLLNAGFLSLGLSPGKPFEIREKHPSNPPGGLPFGDEEEPLEYYPPAGPRVYIYVTWKDGEREIVQRAEDLLVDRMTGELMPRDGWVFLGSRFGVNPETGDEEFVADVTKDLISIWHSYRGNSILDNPHPGGMRDDTYVPRLDLVPERGTPVTVRFRLEPLESEPDPIPLQMASESSDAGAGASTESVPTNAGESDGDESGTGGGEAR